MERKRRDLLLHAFFELCCRPLTETKGSDYTQGADDANSNFKEVADSFKPKAIDALDVWWVYFQKQISAVRTFIVHRKVASEGIFSRLTDVINYANILATLIMETRQNPFGEYPELAGMDLIGVPFDQLESAVEKAIDQRHERSLQAAIIAQRAGSAKGD